jgi:hypothetical protein
MFRVYHYQVRGLAHQRTGTPCQDRTAYVARNGVQVLCLADGAGSAAKAEFGAQYVVDTGCAHLADPYRDLFAQSNEQIKDELLARLLDRLDEGSKSLGCAVRDLASTFLAVVVSRDEFIAIHLGDGVIGAEVDGELVVISSPDNGEFANETVFVTSKDASKSLRLVRGASLGVTGFIVMSDGAADSLYSQRSDTLANACRKLMQTLAQAPSTKSRNPEHKKQLKRAIDVVIRHRTDDDCAVGILARREIDRVSK